MKDFLYFLFYHLIVYVNTAIILSIIIRFAKRKEEKDARKPKATTDNCCFDCKMFSWMKPSSDVGCYLPFCDNISRFLDDDPHEFSCSNHAKMEQKEINMRETIHEDEMRKEDAKEHKHDKFSCLRYPFCNLTREQVLDGLDRYIKDLHPNDLLDRIENEIRKRNKDDEMNAVAKLLDAYHKLGSAGTSTTDEVAEKFNEIAKARYTKQITTEEAETPPCKLCRHYVPDEHINLYGRCVQNDEIVHPYDRKGCFEKKLLCGDCQFFVPTEGKSVESPFSDGYCGRSIDKNRTRRTRQPCNRFQIRTSRVEPKPAPDKSDKSEKDVGICNKCKNGRTLPNTGNIYCGRYKEEKHFKTIGCSAYAEKSCENCRFSTENDRSNPNTVTCHFKQGHPVLRPRDGACWTCEQYSRGIKP